MYFHPVFDKSGKNIWNWDFLEFWQNSSVRLDVNVYVLLTNHRSAIHFYSKSKSYMEYIFKLMKYNVKHFLWRRKPLILLNMDRFQSLHDPLACLMRRLNNRNFPGLFDIARNYFSQLYRKAPRSCDWRLNVNGPSEETGKKPRSRVTTGVAR